MRQIGGEPARYNNNSSSESNNDSQRHTKDNRENRSQQYEVCLILLYLKIHLI